jgi:predicted permease
MRLLTKLRLLLRREEFHREMEEEMAFHFDALVKELEAAGMSPEEARRQAKLRFGNRDSVEERTHSVAAFTWESVFHDLRYALRILRKNRILTTVVVISLALGIGANIGIFTVMNAVMLRMLPVREPERLVLLTSAVKAGFFPEDYVHDYEGSSSVDEKTQMNVGTSVSTQTYEMIKKESTVLEQTFAFAANDEAVNVGLEGRAEPATVQAVTGNFFEGLGVVPLLGRGMAPYDEEASATPVAVVSYKFWVNQLGGDKGAIGKKVTINDAPVQLIGVAPAEFFGVDPSIAPDFWVPLSFYRAQWMRHASPDENLDSHFVWWLTVVGRLKPEVTPGQASAELSVLFARSIGAHGATSGDPKIPTLRLEEAKTGLNHLRLRFSKSLWLLMAMVGLVLLIACANVAALLLARATARQREVATRMSLGARRRRVVRQLLTESVVLSAAGGLAGLVLSHWITRFLVGLLDRRRDSIGLSVHIDPRVLAFAMVVSIGCGLVFGLAPALRATSAQIVPMLKQSGTATSISGRHFRFGKLLVAAQVALCVLLLVTAGLLVRTLKRLQNVDLGFNKERVATFVVRPGMNGYQDPVVVTYYEELLRRVQALPGVHSTTYAQFGPIGEGMSSSETYVPGYNTPEKRSEYYRHVVGENYFETLQVPVLLGRALGTQDTRAAKHVVVINEKAAKEIFHGDNPIGRQMVMGSRKEPNACEVVGVVRDVRYAQIRDDVPPTVYFPIEQMVWTPNQVSYMVRSEGDPKTLFREISATALALNPNVPVVNIKTEDTVVSQNLYMEQTFAMLSSAFAAVGLMLACIGLYGTIAYTVVQRTNEIGVRLALGAARQKIVTMVLREALSVVGWGLALGVPAAWVSTGVLKSQLYGLSPHDSWTMTVAMISIVLVTLAAGFVPARKASRIDPMVALRYE